MSHRSEERWQKKNELKESATKKSHREWQHKRFGQLLLVLKMEERPAALKIAGDYRRRKRPQ